MLAPLRRKKFNTDKFLIVVLLYIYYFFKKQKPDKPKLSRHVNSNLSVMSHYYNLLCKFFN